jgi:excisionase family DNA binding protein
VDLKTASDRLGVHYQTAYRWVRDGSLAANRVGTSYEIEPDVVERLRARRSQPTAPPRAMQVRSWDAQSRRLHDLLVAGEDLPARRLVERLHDGGVDTVTLCEELFTPALRTCGDEWARGRLSIAEEHRATAICDRLLARLTTHPRGRPRGVAVVCTPPGETHALPAAMASVCLRADRWRVHHLGTEVPAADLAAMTGAVDADLVVFSVTLASAGGGADAVLEAGARDGVKVLVGGPGRNLRDLLRRAREP